MKNFVKKILKMFGIQVNQAQAHELAFLRKYNISTVFDIGANVGQFAQEIRDELPDAKIYSFEPVKDTFQKLVKNFSADKNFKGFNIGLGSHKEEKQIKISAYSLSSSFLPQSTILQSVFPHTKEIGVETVSVQTLDAIWHEVGEPKEGVLVKMDTQGFEGEIIDGGQHSLSIAKLLILETSFVEIYTGQPLFADIYEKLKNLGFKYAGSLRAKKHPDSGEVLFEDSIFVRP